MGTRRVKVNPVGSDPPLLVTGFDPTVSTSFLPSARAKGARAGSDLKVLRFIQANLHHSHAGSAVLARRVLKDELNVALIQEPLLDPKDTRVVSGLPRNKGKLIYDSISQGKPRACI